MDPVALGKPRKKSMALSVRGNVPFHWNLALSNVRKIRKPITKVPPWVMHLCKWGICICVHISHSVNKHRCHTLPEWKVILDSSKFLQYPWRKTGGKELSPDNTGPMLFLTLSDEWSLLWMTTQEKIGPTSENACTLHRWQYHIGL